MSSGRRRKGRQRVPESTLNLRGEWRHTRAGTLRTSLFIFYCYYYTGEGFRKRDPPRPDEKEVVRSFAGGARLRLPGAFASWIVEAVTYSRCESRAGRDE